MRATTPEGVQSPTTNTSNCPLGIGQEVIQRRPTILRPADATVHVFDSRPIPRGAGAAQFLKLVLGLVSALPAPVTPTLSSTGSRSHRKVALEPVGDTLPTCLA